MSFTFFSFGSFVLNVLELVYFALCHFFPSEIVITGGYFKQFSLCSRFGLHIRVKTKKIIYFDLLV